MKLFFCSLCEVAAPVRKVTVRGLCELSIFDRCSASPSFEPTFQTLHAYISNDITSLMTAGSTTTSSTRLASPCLWELTPLSYSTTDLWAPGSGGASAIICKQYQINHVSHWWQHRFLIDLQFRYDRKDTTIVAVSLSPEGSLLLGFHKSVFSFYPNQLPLYKLVLKACTASTSPKCATTNVTLELDSPGWGHVNPFLNLVRSHPYL